MFGTPLRRGQRPDETPALRRDRARNDQRLKGRFERIFDKYNKDFTAVGDEIDLLTGTVVVDNGHLSNMQDERDTGASASRNFVRAFTQELGTEDHLESQAIRRMRSTYASPRTPTRSMAGSVEHVSDAEDELRSSPQSSPDVAPPPQPQPPQPARMEDALAQSSAALISLARAGQGSSSAIDPDAIQSLGTALAGQIASFLQQQLATQFQPTANAKWAVPPFSHAQHIPAPSFGQSQVPPSPSIRSVSPYDGLSLWATDDESAYDRPYKRQRLLHGREEHDYDQPMESVEDAHWDSRSPSLEAEDSTDGAGHRDFMEQARFNFQTLAHGIANRGYMVDDDYKHEDGLNHNPGHARPTQKAKLVFRRFTKQEDARIVRMKEKQGMSWAEIAQHFPDRTEASLQVRYNRSLKPGALRFKQGYVVELEDDEGEAETMPEASSVSKAPLASAAAPSHTSNASGAGVSNGQFTFHNHTASSASHMPAPTVIPPVSAPRPNGFAHFSGARQNGFNHNQYVSGPHPTFNNNSDSASFGSGLRDKNTFVTFNPYGLAGMFEPEPARQGTVDTLCYGADTDSLADEQEKPPTEFVLVDPHADTHTKRAPGRPRLSEEHKKRKKAERTKKAKKARNVFIHVQPDATGAAGPTRERRDRKEPKPGSVRRKKVVTIDADEMPDGDKEKRVPSLASQMEPIRIETVSRSPEPTDATMVMSDHETASGTRLVTPETSRSVSEPPAPEMQGSPRYNFPLDPALASGTPAGGKKTSSKRRMSTSSATRIASSPPPAATPINRKAKSPAKRPAVLAGSGGQPLRSSRLRNNTLSSPAHDRASPATSRRSADSFRMGPVPVQDASDDDL